MVKKILKGFLYIVLLASVSFFAYQGLNKWRTSQDLKEIEGSPQGKLPNLATPLQYHLSLNIDPHKDQFEGLQIISLKINEKTDHFYFHGKDLEVTSIDTQDQAHQPIVTQYKELGHSGVAKVSFDKALEPQVVEISIKYHAEFSNKLAGLYKVTTDKIPYIVTQFEATDARRAFPSFDEPRFKVPFTLTMTVPEKLVAISNTPELSRKDIADHQVEIQFAQTKPLPSYLIAMAVGDFDLVKYEDIPPNQYRQAAIPLSALAVKGQGKNLTFALQHTAEIVNALEDYFGRAYPFAKLDLVAVPDFSAGAMENAGLITFREQLLLLGDNPTLAQKRSYYVVNTHELAHQWNGNLVTMPWWDDIWLNESFATWMENKIVNQLYPQLDVAEEAIGDAHSVMVSDAYLAARKIREPITNNGDIENAFDGITYQKGGAVLNMFEQYIGAETFKKGVRLYLNQHAFANATAADFINALVQVSGKNELVSSFNGFLEQSGVPLVSVDWKCDKDQMAKTPQLIVELQQGRYLPMGSKGSPQRNWNIPVCLQSVYGDHSQSDCLLMKSPRQHVQFAVTSCPLAVLPNASGAGYYRWTLQPAQWKKLLSNLNAMSQQDLISIASTLLAEVKAGRVSPSDFLQATTNFVALADKKSKVLPIEGLEFISEYLVNEDEKSKMSGFVKSLYHPTLEELGLEANTPMDKENPDQTAKLRLRLLRLFALNLNDNELRETLSERGQNYIGYGSDNKIHSDAINGDLASLAMGIALQQNGAEYFKQLKTQLDATSDGTIRQRILSAISMVRDEKLAEQALSMVSSLDTRLNEKGLIIFGQMQEPLARQRTYQWVKNKYALLSLVLPENYLAYVPRIGQPFCDQATYQDLKNFFEPKMAKLVGGKRNLADALEHIETCAALKNSIKTVEIPILSYQG